MFNHALNFIKTLISNKMEKIILDKVGRVLNVFETGKEEGDYANVTIFPDGKFPDGTRGKRQITFGAKQTTEQSNLNKLIEMYIAANGLFADEFKTYLPKIGVESLVNDSIFIDLLKLTGSDPIMKDTQDAFFNEVYMIPARKWFDENGFTLPLSIAVIFDSFIHSGKIRDDIRNMKGFTEVPPAKGGNEKTWIEQYVIAREQWLLKRSDPILRLTVYRMKTFKAAIKADNWDLKKPLYANGLTIKHVMVKIPLIHPKGVKY
jgi:chitosanase